MFESKKHVLPLYDQHGTLLGILLSPEIWSLTETAISPPLDAALRKLEGVEPEPEPLEDWEKLLKFWDFKYPVDKSVHCDTCGAHTVDWTADDPRLFRLSAASFGGLVIFECQQCQSRITKKHFKHRIESTTTPPRQG